VDESWFADVGLDEAMERVWGRQVGNGADPGDARARVEGNDRPYGSEVLRTRGSADVVVPSGLPVASPAGSGAGAAAAGAAGAARAVEASVLWGTAPRPGAGASDDFFGSGLPVAASYAGPTTPSWGSAPAPGGDTLPPGGPAAPLEASVAGQHLGGVAMSDSFAQALRDAQRRGGGGSLPPVDFFGGAASPDSAPGPPVAASFHPVPAPAAAPGPPGFYGAPSAPAPPPVPATGEQLLRSGDYDDPEGFAGAPPPAPPLRGVEVPEGFAAALRDATARGRGGLPAGAAPVPGGPAEGDPRDARAAPTREGLAALERRGAEARARAAMPADESVLRAAIEHCRGSVERLSRERGELDAMLRGDREQLARLEGLLRDVLAGRQGRRPLGLCVGVEKQEPW